ncbi:MAG: hypothetical protein U0P30_10140 [Vicinamibacterales bacterium]
MTDRTRFVRITVVLFFFAAMGGLRMIDRPGLQNVRPVDIVQVLGTGMCLGAGLMAAGVAASGRRQG